jgi:hypothetical protein
MIQDIKSITSGSLNSNGLEDPFNSFGSNEEEKEKLLNERQLTLDEKRLLLSREELRKSDLLINAMDALALNLRVAFGNAPSPTPTNNRTNTDSSVSSNVSNSNISQSNGMMMSVSNRFNSYKTDTINQAKRVEPTIGLSGIIATRYKPSDMTANKAGNVSNTNSSNKAGNVSNTNSSNTNINNLSDIDEQQLAELKKIVSAGIISHKVQEETSDNIDELVKSGNLAELHAEEIRLEKNNGGGFQKAANSNNTNMGSGVTGAAKPSGSILSTLTDMAAIVPSPLGVGKNAPTPPRPTPSGGSRLSRGLGVLKAGVLARGPALLRGVSGGIGGLLGEMALNAGGDALEEAGHEKLGAGARIGAKAASYAGMGAMLGSVVPGVGTAIGAGLGGVAGGVMGLYENFETLMGTKGEENKDLTETIKSNTIAVEDAKEQTKTEASTNIVNAPVSTVNNTTSVNSRTAIRNQDPFIIQSLRYSMI